MNVGQAAQVYNAFNNLARQREIINFAKKYGGEKGKVVAKEFKRFNIITLLIIFLVIVPLVFYTVFSIGNNIEPKYPAGATQEKHGYVSLYSDDFWYTSNQQQYKFNFNDLNIENDFEPGDKIIIYLDDHNDIVSVAHVDSGIGVVINIMLTFVISIVLIVGHMIIGRITYAKNYVKYCKWYEIAIEPYRNKANFDKIAENTKYQDIDTLIKMLDEKTLKKYKKYKRINMLLSITFLVPIPFLIGITSYLDIQVYSLTFIVPVVVYVMAFMIPMNIIDSRIKQIKIDIFNNLKNAAKQC